ncbi:MAG: DnaJ domain-containing protein [Desulfobacterales bacterium]|nr:DnaJ domain-containing protein [Desulfobacterales bacterium]MDD4072270.1 DnaJ domain-containing protein [Desulfobacterales bacterium]MDD4392807.1 DnaJ domain-containing protein [Desulfobacterales bacterium]
MQNKDYYAVLEVASDAGVEEIKRSYRRLALCYHPDTNGGDTESEERFKQINEAYSILSDGDTRRRYDAYGHAGFQENGSYDDDLSARFSGDPRGFGGNFHCRGKGMGGGFGRRGCGMRGHFPFGFETRGGRQAARWIVDLPLTSAEARTGTVKEILFNAGDVTVRVNLKTPAGMEAGGLVLMKAENTEQVRQDICFRVVLVD